MNPDLKSQVEELKREVDSLRVQVNALSNPSELSPHLVATLKDKIHTDELTVSAKSASSEDVTVNEAGTNTYSVMNDPDGFLEVEISGTTYYLPYFG